MIAFKVTTVLFSLFFLSSTVLATPPACLLAAVNTEPDPADLGTICGTDASKVQRVIASLCGSNNAAAQSAFSSTCLVAGKTVSPYTATGTSKATGTPDGSYVYTTYGFDPACSCTHTYVTSAEATSGAFTAASATATKSGSSSTGAAAPKAAAADVGSFAAAVIALAGVVAVL